MIYFYTVSQSIIDERIHFAFNYNELGTVDDINPLSYPSFCATIDEGFRIALAREMKKFTHTVLLEPEPFVDCGYRFVNWETELKVEIYNELVTMENMSLLSIASMLTTIDNTMTIEKLHNLLDVTLPVDVSALLNIARAINFPIKIEMRPVIVTCNGY